MSQADETQTFRQWCIEAHVSAAEAHHMVTHHKLAAPEALPLTDDTQGTAVEFSALRDATQKARI